jgi:aquaporin Z
VAQALAMEVVLTLLLVTVILNTATRHRLLGPDAALPVGATVALCGLFAAPVSGASMNPARSFGPALVSGDFDGYWAYFAGPLAGAIIAVGCAIILRGRGGDPTSYAAGSGTLQEAAHPRGTASRRAERGT